MDKTIDQIKQELKAKSKKLSKKDLEWARKIVGQDFTPLGVPLAAVWKISRDVYKKNNNVNYDQALKIAEKLLHSKYQEEKFAGLGFMNNFRNEFDENTLKVFKLWIDKYCHNWAFCDSFCINVIGPFLGKNLELVPKVEPWAKDKNMWIQRASLVSVLKISRFLEPKYIFKRATPFMQSKEPFLQKATGWLLKESSKWHKDEVIAFLLKWKDKTPRSVLRYACEKLPPGDKKKVLD
jgi:3-methyladenine DNA glycosylase AlkD